LFPAAAPATTDDVASKGPRHRDPRGGRELDRNPTLSRDEIAATYRRTLGARHVIWLERGPKEEEWRRLEDGRWAIETGGHIDTFCRFADPRTILLAEVSEEQARVWDALDK
jgi:agmatine/peptidylarginine deiminase